MSIRLLSYIGMVALCAAVGCGPGVGKVSGVVTANGKPVPAGLVTFRPDDPTANSISAELDREGRYSVELPAGPCRVAVDNRQYEPLPKPGGGIPSGISLPAEVLAKLKQAPPSEAAPEIDPTTTADAPVARESGLYVKLPEKYYLVETSGLTFEVEPGEQKMDLELQ